jgi:5-deoxy-D-glucuronate isomerase
LELDWLESASIDSDPVVVVIWPTEDMSSMPIKPHDREIFGTISIY